MRLKVKVYPSAGREEVTREEDGSFKVKLTAPPERGKANKELLKLMAGELKIPKSRLSIKSGKHSRTKIIEIGADSE